MTSPSDNDKNKDAASDAKPSGGENKADKTNAAKETLNKIIYKTGELAGKAFAVAKAVTKNVVQELRNVNSIRKETVATAAEGTKKTDLAKTFWTKTSGKQRSIVFGLTVIIVFVLYSVLSTSGEQYHKEANDFYKNKNYVKALELYKKSADKGFINAYYDVGVMLIRGQGTPKNDVEASKWLKLGAEKGDANSQSLLGLAYAGGEGVVKNMEESLRWLKLAAKQGNPVALFEVGKFYFRGDLIAKDYVKGLSLTSLAITYGNNDAKSIHDRFTKIMTKEQIAEAQNLATQCLSSKYKNCDSLKPSSLSSTKTTQPQASAVQKNKDSTATTNKNSQLTSKFASSELGEIATCIANAELFIENAKGTAYKTNDAQRWLSGWRIALNYSKEWESYKNQMIENMSYLDSVTTNLIKFEQCSVNYPNPWSKINLIEGTNPNLSCSQRCNGRYQLCLSSNPNPHPSTFAQWNTHCRNFDNVCRGSGTQACN